MDFSSYWHRIGGKAEDLDTASQGWSDSQACYPDDGPDFLSAAAIHGNCQWAGFGESDEALFQACARIVRSDGELSRLAWHFYWRVFLDAEFRALKGVPSLPQLGELSGVFYALVGLGYVPLVREYHQRLGIPEETTRETLRQIWIFCNVNYRRGHQGRFGIYLGQLNWLHHYTCSPMFRIGRFEYWIQPSFRDVRVYRNRSTGAIMAFPPDGTLFDSRGYCYRSPADYRTAAWAAVCVEKDGAVTGTPFSREGYAENRLVTLPLSDWEAVIAPGTVCLSMHIPAGGHMELEACRESLRKAKQFFREHFPDMPARAVVSSSWIFNPDLPRIVGEESNLARLQKEVFVHVIPSSVQDGLWFIFLNDAPLELKTAPRETRLQRQVLAFMEQGGEWRAGGMFILMEDIDRFGEQASSQP